MGAVLVVDDDVHIRDAIRLILTRAGYQVLLAESGREAIDLLRRDQQGPSVAVLLCDLDMPEMGGMALIEQVHASHPLVPIIVLSGAEDFVFLDALAKQGVNDWLRKPASRDDLLDKVRVAVRLHELRKKDHQP
jgi:FixJ family two-component response regulator